MSVKSAPPLLALIAIALIVAVVVLFLVVIRGGSDSTPERRPDGIPPTAFLGADSEHGRA
jgi:hypothetical protein